jgi:hypothetical protein
MQNKQKILIRSEKEKEEKRKEKELVKVLFLDALTEIMLPILLPMRLVWR